MDSVTICGQAFQVDEIAKFEQSCKSVIDAEGDLSDPYWRHFKPGPTIVTTVNLSDGRRFREVTDNPNYRP